jgi:hypothetical protein
MRYYNMLIIDDVGSSAFTLDREVLIQAAKPPHFGNSGGGLPIMHPPLTEEQEWELRRDFAVMDAQRQQMMTDFDDQEATRVFVRS